MFPFKGENKRILLFKIGYIIKQSEGLTSSQTLTYSVPRMANNLTVQVRYGGM